MCLFQSALDRTLYLIQALSVITHHAGFNVETVSYKNVDFVTLGVGGRGKIVSIGRLAFTVYYVVGFNVETITYNRIDFVTWDVSGRDKIVSCSCLCFFD